MPEMLRDGTGNGNLLRINNDNQIVARSTAVPQRTKSTVDGNYYECTTGQLTATDALEKSVMYLQNTDSMGRYLVVDRVFLDTWTSTGGSGADGTLRYYKNAAVTGAGTALVPVGTNFSNPVAAQGNFGYGYASMSGTVWWIMRFTDKLDTDWSEEAFCLPPGATFGITMAAPTGNTSMKYNLNVGFYYLDTTRL